MSIDPIGVKREAYYSGRGDTAEDTFRARLLEFRRDIAFQKIESPAKGDDEKENPSIRKRADSVQLFHQNLFSAWDDSLSAEDALRELDGNLAKIGEFSLESELDPREALEHFASQYSVFKKHISKMGGEQFLGKLDQVMEKHVDRYARSFSQIVGGFYEKNGLEGETERLYNSIKGRVEILSKSYDWFITCHQEDYDQMRQEAGQGRSCLAFGLRAAYRQDGDGEVFSYDQDFAYTRDELSAAAELVKLAAAGAKDGKAGDVSEEELGVRYGAMILRGMSVLQGSQARAEHKGAFLANVYSRIDGLLDESDHILKENGERLLERDIVHSIMDQMAGRFRETKSFGAAIQFGEDLGLRSYFTRRKFCGDALRYQFSSYWERRLENLRTRTGAEAGALLASILDAKA